MKLFARKVNNYSLYASHAWYVPGVKGMFGLLGWFILGNLLAIVVQAIFSAFIPMDLVQKYSMLVLYPLSFIPAMLANRASATACSKPDTSSVPITSAV